MSHETDALDTTLPAGGQTVRLPGSDHSTALHDQLYRYAEDLQQMIERNDKLKTHCEKLLESSAVLVEGLEEMNKLVLNSRDIYIVTDTTGTIIQINPAGEALVPSRLLLKCKLQDLVMPSDCEKLIALQSKTIESGVSTVQTCEMSLCRENRDEPPLIVSAQVLVVRKEGKVCFLRWVLRDITHLREIEFETQISSLVFKSAAEGMMITDIEGQILVVNPAFCRITGYSAEEAIGRNPKLLSSGIQDADFYSNLWTSLLKNGSWQGHIYNCKKNGEIYLEWLTINAARDSDGSILSFVAVFFDSTQLLLAAKTMDHLAHHDTLTKIPNRLLLQVQIEQALSQSKHTSAPFTLILIDLDQFQQINDTLGHKIGDRAIQETAKRLTNAAREEDTVSRFGGDKFVIFAPGLAGDADIWQLCDKVTEALRQPMQIDGHELSLSGSLGCVECPRYGDDEVTLLKHADAAMVQAKAAGGNTQFIYGSAVIPSP